MKPATQSPEVNSVSLPAVSVLICTKGHHADAEKAVISVQRCGYPADLLHIAVLEETDTPQPIDGADYHTLPLLHKGFGYARNESLKLARHEIIVFFDDDCIAEPGWLENLVKPLAEQPELLATGGRVRVPACGPIGECENILGFPGGGVKLLHKSAGKPMHTATFSTCNAAVRLSAIQEAGGFNEARRFGREDEELSRYISRNGQVLFIPDAAVLHAPRDSMRAIWRWFFRRGRAAGECRQDRVYFLKINIWLRLLAAVLVSWILFRSVMPVLILLSALYYAGTLWRSRWARRYFPRTQTRLILPGVKWVMDAAMSAGFLFEWLCFPKKRNR